MHKNLLIKVRSKLLGSAVLMTKKPNKTFNLASKNPLAGTSPFAFFVPTLRAGYHKNRKQVGPVNSALGSGMQGSITYQAKVKTLYIPRFNKIEDSRTIYDHILKNPLGAWSSLVGGEIEINHVPFLLKENQGEYGTLTCHVSKANDIWKNIDQGKNSIIAFQGEQSYISPSWYPSKEETGKEVPTWNYTVVHAYGIPKIITDKDWLLNHVDEQTNLYENKLDDPWKISDAPKDFIDRLASAIIGIEIPISRLEGKWKIGQNKSDKDQKGMIRGLVSSGESNSQALGQVLEKGRKA